MPNTSPRVPVPQIPPLSMLLILCVELTSSLTHCLPSDGIWLMSLPSEPTEMPPQWPMPSQWLSPTQPQPRGICSVFALLHVCSSRTALKRGPDRSWSVRRDPGHTMRWTCWRWGHGSLLSTSLPGDLRHNRLKFAALSTTKFAIIF